MRSERTINVVNPFSGQGEAAAEEPLSISLASAFRSLFHTRLYSHMGELDMCDCEPASRPINRSSPADWRGRRGRIRLHFRLPLNYAAEEKNPSLFLPPKRVQLKGRNKGQIRPLVTLLLLLLLVQDSCVRVIKPFVTT